MISWLHRLYQPLLGDANYGGAGTRRSTSVEEPLPWSQTVVEEEVVSLEVELERGEEEKRAEPQKSTSTFRMLLLMVGTALAIRLICMCFMYPNQLKPQYDRFAFGYETGRIARSIVQGEGFSSPLFVKTGPTAWMTPVYPYIIAGFFKVFGVYTKSAAFAVLTLQSLISALTCLPIFFFARKGFGPQVAKWSGWAWALFPYAIYFPLDRIWETWLATLLFSIAFLITLYLEDANRITAWVGAGLLWGVAAMTSAALLSVLPFLQARISCLRHKQGRRWLAPNLALGLAFAAVISPWIVRNNLTFHKFIPFRDNMGLVLRLGTKGVRNYWEPAELGPWLNQAEVAEFHRDGEIKYMATKKAQAIEFIKANPGWYASATARRIVFLWTGYWSLDKSYLKIEPWDPADIPFCSVFTLLALIGVVRVWKRNRHAAIPYAILLVVFPLIYYITSPEYYYRRPLDPMMLVLSVCALMPSRLLGEPSDLASSDAVVEEDEFAPELAV